ncbi:MAG TPA: transporter substrate-binding domain-containing protein [Candidatus Limnocylindria bacterium]|nr:transporter substrate-binding domain-containing protein [Candidatus Limnocylindria bacterium]
MGKRGPLLALLVLLSACAPQPAASAPSPSAARTATPDPLASLRARGTLVVSVRMEGPGGGRTPGDPAHTRKRALEAAIGEALAARILGAGAKAELRGAGRDRLAPLVSRQADVALTLRTFATEGIVYSTPYAAGGLVLVAAAAGPVRDLSALAAKTVAVTPGEVEGDAALQALLRAQGVSPQLRAFDGLTQAVDALEAGEVAAVVGDRVASALLGEQRPGRLRVIADVVKQPYTVATRADARDLAAKVDEAIKAMLASGEIGEMAKRAGVPWEAP